MKARIRLSSKKSAAASASEPLLIIPSAFFGVSAGMSDNPRPHGTHASAHQARRTPARTRRTHPDPIRRKRAQNHRPEADDDERGAGSPALRPPRRTAVLPGSREVHDVGADSRRGPRGAARHRHHAHADGRDVRLEGGARHDPRRLFELHRLQPRARIGYAPKTRRARSRCSSRTTSFTPPTARSTPG